MSTAKALAAALGALLLVSCSGGPPAPASRLASVPASSIAPASSPAAPGSTPTASAAALATATATPLVEASVAPSLSGGADLTAFSFPTEVGGYPFQAAILPTNLVQGATGQNYAQFAAALAVPISALIVAQGGVAASMSDNVTVEAIRVPGASTDQLKQAEIDRLLSVLVPGSKVTSTTLGDKSVTQIGVQDPSFPKLARYVYAAGDTVYTVSGPVDALNAALISALP